MKINLLIGITNKNNHHYAYAYSVSDAYNLYPLINNIKGVSSVNVCKTLKEAKQNADIWNNIYKNNNSLMSYDEIAEM